MADGFRAEIKGDQEFKKKIVNLRKEISAILEEAALAGADVIKDEANRLAPGPHIETDVVESTWTHADVEIGPDKEHWYYRFFETGTSAHEVTPKTAGGLAFPWGGEMIVRMISHPSGMAAQPFLRPARDEKEKEADEATGRKFLEVINRHLEK